MTKQKLSHRDLATSILYILKAAGSIRYGEYTLVPNNILYQVICIDLEGNDTTFPLTLNGILNICTLIDW